MLKRKFIITLSLLSVITLSSCEGVKDDLGLGRNIPDEFAITKRAPLEIPDSFTLRAPQPGAARPQEKSVYEAAIKTVLGNADTETSSTSKLEQQILNNAGATKAQPNIRTIVDKETANFEGHKIPVVKKLLNIGRATPMSEIVDAKKEAIRINENIKAGRPVTTGETPTIVE